jgi:hypothetical protein
MSGSSEEEAGLVLKGEEISVGDLHTLSSMLHGKQVTHARGYHEYSEQEKNQMAEFEVIGGREREKLK